VRAVVDIHYHNIVLLLSTKLQICFIVSLELFLLTSLFRAHNTTTSSLFRFSVSFAVSVITLSTAPGFTKLDHSQAAVQQYNVLQDSLQLSLFYAFSLLSLLLFVLSGSASS